MDENNNWNVSEDNKKHGKKRFLRQLIVFLIFIIIIAVVAVVVFFKLNNKDTKPSVKEPVFDENGEVVETNEEGEKVSSEGKVEKTRNSLENIVYSIENKDFYFDGDEEDDYSGIKLYEYDNSNNRYALIYYCLHSYTTDPSYSYVIEAKDENGESLLLNDRDNSVSERDVMGGIISSIKIDKEKVGTKITIRVKEMCERSAKSRTVEKQTTTVLDLSQDLEEKVENNRKNDTVRYELEGFKFEACKDDKVNKSTYTMYSPKCKTTAYSIELSSQYGNRLVSDASIEFSVLNNINELTLDEAFEIEKQIDEKIGHYGLADKYKIYVTNGSGEITSEFEFTFDEMKKLINGESININGKRVAIQDITDGNATTEYTNVSKVFIADKVPAMKYNYKNETDVTRYMFMLNGYIYYLSIPNGERYEENVNVFLDSLKQK